MTLSDFLLVAKLQTGFLGLVALTSFVFFKKRNKAIKFLGLLFFLGFSVQVFSLSISHFNTSSISNGDLRNFAGSMYDFILVIIIGLFYNSLFKFKYKKNLIIITLAYVVFALCNLLFIQTKGSASYNHLLGSALIICYAIVYFYRLMVDLPATNLYRYPMFWFNTAFLFFHSTTFFIYAFSDYLVKVLNNNLIVYYSVHNVLSIIECCILLFGLYLDLTGVLKLQKSPKQ